MTRESAFIFDCADDELVGVITLPDDDAGGSLGVLVVVGGPQYRVGSHRQFVLLARQLAEAGLITMRFDCRGMGDATGEPPGFENIEADIRAAIDAFCARVPRIRRVVLWGLCDGASASCFYAASDERVAGVVLLNPWVRTPGGVARTYLKHYYLQRVTDPGFWKKLLVGGVSLGGAVGGLLRTARMAKAPGRGATESGEEALPQRMARSLARSHKPFFIVLSGRDYVAREFEEAAARSDDWESLEFATQLARLTDADHTFSRGDWRRSVGALTAAWVRSLGRETTGDRT